jgi:hypothetical protein
MLGLKPAVVWGITRLVRLGPQSLRPNREPGR